MTSVSKIDLYLDDTMDRVERRQYEDHLKTCEACQAEVDFATCLDEKIQEAWNSVETPASVWSGRQPRFTIAPRGNQNQTNGLFK